MSELLGRTVKSRLVELLRAEIVRGDLKPGERLRLEAIDKFKRNHRIKTIVSYIADDFDDPLPEDFLLRVLPPNR